MTEIPNPGDRFQLKHYSSLADVADDIVSDYWKGYFGDGTNLPDLEAFFAGTDGVWEFVDAGDEGEWSLHRPDDYSKQFKNCDPGWLEPAAPPLPRCTCPHSYGCICGAMLAEMAAKGFRKNSATGSWERIEA